MTPAEQAELYHVQLFKPQFEKHLNYLQIDRGLTKASIDRFKLGVKEDGAISIPITVDSEVLGIKYRRNPFEESDSPKYLNPTGLSTQIFNQDTLELRPRNLVITEGEFDAIVLEQYGIAAITQTTGKGFPAEFIRSVKDSAVVVGFDNDAAGMRAMFNLAEEMHPTKQDIRFCVLPGAQKDWNELVASLQSQGKPDSEIRTYLEDEIIRRNCRFIDEFIQCYYYDFAKDRSILATLPLSQIEAVDEDFLVEPLLICGGINLLTGLPASMKSMVAAHLCVSCLTGTPLFGQYKTRRVRKVLLLDQENKPAEIRKRIDGFAATVESTGHEASFVRDRIILPAEPIYFDNQPNLIAKIIELIKLEGIELVVIDTMRRTNSRMDENNSKDVANFFAGMKELQRYATILVIHHETKGSESSYRGSGDIQAAVDSHISIKKQDKNLILTHHKARYLPEKRPVRLRFIFGEGMFSFEFIDELDQSEDVAGANRVKQKGLLSKFISSSAEGKDLESIEKFAKENLNMGQHAVRNLRLELQDQGLIEELKQARGKRNLYRAVTSSQQLTT